MLEDKLILNGKAKFFLIDIERGTCSKPTVVTTNNLNYSFIISDFNGIQPNNMSYIDVNHPVATVSSDTAPNCIIGECETLQSDCETNFTQMSKIFKGAINKWEWSINTSVSFNSTVVCVKCESNSKAFYYSNITLEVVNPCLDYISFVGLLPSYDYYANAAVPTTLLADSVTSNSTFCPIMSI